MATGAEDVGRKEVMEGRGENVLEIDDVVPDQDWHGLFHPLGDRNEIMTFRTGV